MRLRFAALVVLLTVVSAAAQESTPLSVDPATPRAVLRQPYRHQLKALGGIAPYRWEVTGGSLPEGISLGSDGVLSGVPTDTGEFHFEVTVTDNAKPPHQKSQEIGVRVKAGLVAEWKQAPQLDGTRLHGSVLVTNGSNDDYDLTVIVLAVNEIGKAFAAGYQHGPLNKDASIEVPFEDTLPDGAYLVNVDVAGEIPSKNQIYRTRLFTGTPMKVQSQ